MQVTIFDQQVEVTRTEMPSGAVRYSLECQDCTSSAMVQVGGNHQGNSMAKAKNTSTVTMGADALKIKKAPGRGVYVRAMHRSTTVSRWVYIPGGTVSAATAYPWTYWEAAICG